jgi:hypothetical protein
MSASMFILTLQSPDNAPHTTLFVRINAKTLVNIAKEYNVPVTPYVISLCSDYLLEPIRGSDPTSFVNTRSA